MADRQTVFVPAGRLVYTGGGAHPFAPGAAVSLDPKHAADLLASKHVADKIDPPKGADKGRADKAKASDA